MTIFELYKICEKELQNANVENASFEARLICEYVTSLTNTDFLLKRGRQATTEEEIKVKECIKKRISLVPVQYITGKWEFLDLEFSVGEGVLIPRPETEELVLYAKEKIENTQRKVVFDLCSGSGCIGLAIKHLLPECDVYMIEKSDDALLYLQKNREDLGFGANTVCVKGDILCGYESFDFLPKPDVIISNPPYIKKDDIKSLQKEVLKEPIMALDGGKDGLIFYRNLCEKWFPYINNGGFIAVECGEEQAEDIASLFVHNSTETEIIKDFNGYNRMVAAFK